MALALKNMKASGANVTINPDEFVRQLKERSLPDILSEIRDENVKYEQWKKVEMVDGYTTTGCKVTALEFQYALWTSSAEQHEKFSAKSI
jgi:hypothetical protein